MINKAPCLSSSTRCKKEDAFWVPMNRAPDPSAQPALPDQVMKYISHFLPIAEIACFIMYVREEKGEKY